ncbi:NAD(P)H pyrophosphatase NUDT13, mitochondrial-like [Melanotaenia boesemani]|uniref:NAD(P)H pyrophosphatase NUDT13, mitochondrial-like n=1 Tax=Melanotaenia boesemani TaxID=1250792 RepID=UPI001C056A2F|nr:NAD(P)H pyrophosphatase NUDT13, mitochondrial-like [Melanotaenia boesemani]XP_041829936.1 NAD(P)H pyrophosphatase NUDT13, mitochondrial-like [Melanotaenia boesemani]XP_041829937.1 NAD(P)H pyrophosphatase NUDT13, mitochondrial-like [Melanotaenia boesemani]XP_041829938.1 NAD(P)H pyrophosphatase NUDT13, mitochondrial-like [Melanotaenia boesemani]XP_041829939.1 NAD(P)H pyrophosphatase NUDT13, mitochondrial-like [Melanotaenia boesemani]
MAALLRPLRIFLSTNHCAATCRCSSFVSRMRLVNRLKEDDELCVAALQDGVFFLFHRLSPLLHRGNNGTFRPIPLTCSDLQSVLQRFGSDGSLLKASVLIGCSEQNQAQFCLDVGELDQACVAEACRGTFMDLRKAFFLLPAAESPLVAKGQALLRWHQTNRFCSATGQPTVRNQAGSQRVCSSNGSIIYYPKMSPVVIVLVSDGTRCLLGRQASFPPGLYSALAGFCDMGETLEEALCREVAEEVSLEVQSISYSSSQHWPFPHSSFMLGCHATVSPAHIQLDVDRSELEDARWFTLEEITCALQVKTPPRRGDPPTVWLPPQQAVANYLITEWWDRQRRSENSA